MRKKWQFLLIIFVVLFVLASCNGNSDPAAMTVETYLKALVTQDGASLSNLSCSSWEAQALLEMDAFSSVNPQLEGMVCSTISENGESVHVLCEGKIVTTYNTEVRDFNLGDWIYLVGKEGGEWRVCGYEGS